MKNQSWTFTSIEHGHAVETVHGLQQEDAARAIQAAMIGASLPKLRAVAGGSGTEHQAAALAA